MVQVVFYSLAVVGYFLEVKGWQKRVFAVPFCFCIANLGFVLGVVKAISGKRIVAYESMEHGAGSRGQGVGSRE